MKNILMMNDFSFLLLYQLKMKHWIYIEIPSMLDLDFCSDEEGLPIHWFPLELRRNPLALLHSHLYAPFPELMHWPLRHSREFVAHGSTFCVGRGFPELTIALTKWESLGMHRDKRCHEIIRSNCINIFCWRIEVKFGIRSVVCACDSPWNKEM